MRRPLAWLFAVAWTLGVVATIADVDALLLPAGVVLTLFGASALRRDRARRSMAHGVLVWASGVDMRAYTRLAAALVTMLGVGWTAAGVLAAAGI